MDTSDSSLEKHSQDALVQSLREELAVTNRGIVALNLELEQKMQQMEILNEDLRSFAYSISHDLRQPLRAIDGFSAILQEEYTEQFDEEGRDYLARIRRGVARMNNMVEGLLGLSRATRKEITRQNVALDVIAQNVLAELQERDPDRNAQVHIDSGMFVSADPQLMESVVQNLLSNAWKYTANQPEARILFRREDIDGATVFTVEDNGAGFDMRYADKLFGVFQRLHTENEFEGTGVGLATIQRIIRRHGGKIWAQGELGRGAMFMFTLPNPD